MVCKNHKSVIVFLLVLFLIFSCQTTPRIPDAFHENAANAPLDTGANVYIFASAKEARSIIDLLPIEELKNRQTRQMLDRTDYLAAALFPPTSGKRFQLVTWGKYPHSQANMAFSADRSWQAQRSESGQSYWHSSANRLSLALTSNQAFAASSLRSQPLDPYAASPGIKIPDGFNSFRRSAPLSCWLNNSSVIIERMLNNAGIPMRLPVREIFFNLEPAGGNFEVTARFQFDSVSQARGMIALLSLAAGAISSDQLFSLLFANQPVLNGNNVDIKMASLSERELLTLLDFLLGGFR
ncbi:MAG: hypothetical protein FWC01_04795 [Treponema sp.]|nr:hypothetical protein [Treponema sp.]MCL2237272.1 hypothetical protein [Treponema sp.]